MDLFSMAFRTGLAALLTVSEIRGQTEIFSHLNVLAEGGLNLPRRKLKKHFREKATGAVKLESPYFGHWKCHGTLQYSRLDFRNSSRDVHYIKAAGGMVFHFPAFWIPALGMELGNYSFKTTEKKTEAKQLIDEFESEFGAGPVIFWEFPLNPIVGLRVSAVWDIVFSEPEKSHFLNVMLGFRWSCW